MIYYSDMLGKPYKYGGVKPDTGVDCLWVARTILERIYEDFPSSAMPLSQREADSAIRNAMSGNCGWRKISWPDKIGDVVFGLLEDEHNYVGVLVDVSGRNVLTAIPEHGVVLIPYRKLKGVVGCVRWVGR